MVCCRQQLTILPGKSILCKETPHFCLFWWTRIWVTWLWKDLDAKRLTPGQLLGWPWKLWGITLQTSYVEGRWHQNWAHTSPLHFFTVETQIFAKKSDFLGKTGKFFGAGTHSGFRKYSRFGWPSLCFEVIAAQSEVVGKNQLCYEKSRGVANQSHSANFGPIAWKQIEPGVPISESMFYSFQSDQTKIGGVTLICNGSFTTRQMSKRGPTLALKTAYPHLPYILWTL